MDAATRELVRRRAENQCEYCRATEGPPSRLRFHVEHIVARKHKGSDLADNLALACHLCNGHKGPNLSGIDPQTGRLVPLFHPRNQRWPDHFVDVAGEILGLTEIGRATVYVLGMNHPARVVARRGDAA